MANSKNPSQLWKWVGGWVGPGITAHLCSPLPILSPSGVDRHDCLSPCFSVLCKIWFEMYGVVSTRSAHCPSISVWAFIEVSSLLVRCLSVLNVHFCKKSPKLAQMTFDRYLSNPDIGRTFWDGLTHSN